MGIVAFRSQSWPQSASRPGSLREAASNLDSCQLCRNEFPSYEHSQIPNGCFPTSNRDPPMPKPIHAVAAFALGGTFALVATPALAQDASDRTLLATFCDAPNIKDDSCTHAKGYPAAGNKRNCDVKLLKDRFGGRFVASGNPLLVINYESGCEARANDDGGSVVFELAGGKYSFVGFQPGVRVNDCIVAPRSERQDSLRSEERRVGKGCEADA